MWAHRVKVIEGNIGSCEKEIISSSEFVDVGYLAIIYVAALLSYRIVLSVDQRHNRRNFGGKCSTDMPILVVYPTCLGDYRHFTYRTEQHL